MEVWNEYQTIMNSQVDLDIDGISSDTDETINLYLLYFLFLFFYLCQYSELICGFYEW